MNDSVTVTGMVLSAMPVGDYDKRVVLLTRETGLISAFARGARRPHSQMLAAANPLAFGTFELYRGRNSYTLARANIDEYFMEIAQDYDKLVLAAYFLEMAEYYGLENNDESQRLLLLYQTIRALSSGRFTNRLIRIIYEMRTMKINGEYPDVFSCAGCGKKEHLHYFHMNLRGVICEECHGKQGGMPISGSVLYAMQFIIATPIAKLYTFRLAPDTEDELWNLLAAYLKRYREHRFRSEQFL